MPLGTSLARAGLANRDDRIAPSAAFPPSTIGISSPTGDLGDDVLIGTAQRDVLDGVGGDDVIRGRAGNDRARGRRRRRRLKGEGGDDTVDGDDNSAHGDILGLRRRPSTPVLVQRGRHPGRTNTCEQQRAGLDVPARRGRRLRPRRATVPPVADVTQEAGVQRDLPDRDAAREWLETMMLIRRFEERAGEMYAKAKVGGFLHLAIGEEATIVGACRALRDDDYLISTYRSHGHALARGSDPTA